MERLPPKRGILAWLMGRASKRMTGKQLPQARILAHNIPIALAGGSFEFFQDRAHKADPKLKQLGSMKAAAMAGCPF